MKIVFVPRFFYLSIVFSIILSIYLYFEQDKIKLVDDINRDTKNKYMKFVIYLIIILYLILVSSFRIWIFDIYLWPQFLITLFFLFLLLLYYIYTKI
jgi:hypothetical protein